MVGFIMCFGYILDKNGHSHAQPTSYHIMDLPRNRCTPQNNGSGMKPMFKPFQTIDFWLPFTFFPQPQIMLLVMHSCIHVYIYNMI
jgi:hypothetical protein